MKKDYCTQNNSKCETSRLVNYGVDCCSNPLPVRGETKYDRMMAAYNGHHGPATIASVLAEIPQELKDKLTGRQLGLVMSAVNQSYHHGKASCGAQIVDGDAIWIDKLVGLYKLEDVKTLKPFAVH